MRTHARTRARTRIRAQVSHTRVRNARARARARAHTHTHTQGAHRPRLAERDLDFFRLAREPATGAFESEKAQPAPNIYIYIYIYIYVYIYPKGMAWPRIGPVDPLPRRFLGELPIPRVLAIPIKSGTKSGIAPADWCSRRSAVLGSLFIYWRPGPPRRACFWPMPPTHVPALPGIALADRCWHWSAVQTGTQARHSGSGGFDLRT
jgi:hypothetical protein